MAACVALGPVRLDYLLRSFSVLRRFGAWARTLHRQRESRGARSRARSLWLVRVGAGIAWRDSVATPGSSPAGELLLCAAGRRRQSRFACFSFLRIFFP